MMKYYVELSGKPEEDPIRAYFASEAHTLKGITKAAENALSLKYESDFSGLVDAKNDVRRVVPNMYSAKPEKVLIPLNF